MLKDRPLPARLLYLHWHWQTPYVLCHISFISVALPLAHFFLSNSKVQAHMGRCCFIAARIVQFLLEWFRSGCVGMERFEVVDLAFPLQHSHSTLCVSWGLMAGLQGVANHGGRFCVVVGWPQWSPLDTTGTHLPFSKAADQIIIIILLEKKKFLT